MNNILYKIGNISIVLSILLIGYLVFQLFYPFKTMDIKFTLLNNTVKAGEELEYKVDYCKYTNKQATISIAIVDGILYTLPPFEGAFEKGCGSFIHHIRIPEQMHEGEAHFMSTLEYRMNPLRTIVKRFKSDKFLVQ